MRIHYYKSTQPNLGDDLNAWLWQRLISRRLEESDDTVMFGIGTIINERYPAAERKIIFTSGAGYSASPECINEPSWNVFAVRGPLTAAVLGLPKESAVTDGAILVSLFPEFFTPPDARSGAVFMPHISAARAVDWRPICGAAGIEYLDPRDEHFSLLKRIGSSRLVLADAMHAAIIADSLRVPWVPISTSAEINTFKWLDWTLSLELPYEPTELAPMSFLQLAQNFVICVTCQNHRVRSADINAVLKAYKKLVQRKKAWESLPTRYLSWAFLRTYNSLARSTWMARPRFNVGSNIQLLQGLKNLPGYLSDEATFISRRDELMRRLERLQ